GPLKDTTEQRGVGESPPSAISVIVRRAWLGSFPLLGQGSRSTGAVLPARDPPKLTALARTEQLAETVIATNGSSVLDRCRAYRELKRVSGLAAPARCRAT